MSLAPTVEVEHLGKVYEPASRWFRLVLRSQISAPVHALSDVSLQVERGEICVVAGANGAGKSTLFRVLTGLVEPTSGTARILGMDAAATSTEVRRVFGFVASDDRTLMLRNTVDENLVFWARLQGLKGEHRRRRIDEVLGAVDLGGVRDRSGFALSAGMRARLQIARALLHEPPLLILDEPTGVVDPVGAFELLERVQALARDHGVTVLLSTHRVDEIEALGRSVALLQGGRLVYRGELDPLRSGLQSRQVAIRFDPQCAVDTAEVARRLAAVPGARIHAVSPTEVTVAGDSSAGHLLAALDGAVASIVAVEERRRPTREVLADVLSGRTQATAS